jgi:hypothetical protein
MKTTIAALEVQIKSLSFKVEALQRTDGVFRKTFDAVEERIANLELTAVKTVAGKVGRGAKFAGSKIASGASAVNGKTPRIHRIDGGGFVLGTKRFFEARS